MNKSDLKLYGTCYNISAKSSSQNRPLMDGRAKRLKRPAKEKRFIQKLFRGEMHRMSPTIPFSHLRFSLKDRDFFPCKLNSGHKLRDPRTYLSAQQSKRLTYGCVILRHCKSQKKAPDMRCTGSKYIPRVSVGMRYCDYHLVTRIGYCDHFEHLVLIS